jgi:phosphoenolpyruvate phosphomutase
VVVPTSYGSVKINELISHNIKMVIYANQSLRIAHKSMSRLLNKLKNAESLDDVDEEISDMKEIFELQKMFEINSQEKEIEQKLKKLGYIN